MSGPLPVLCRRCGAENAPGDQFCGSCGAFLEWEGEVAGSASAREPAALPADAGTGETGVPAGGPAPGPVREPAQDGLVRCPACGVANTASRTFCQTCGATLASASRVTERSADAIAAAIAAVPGSSAGPAAPPPPTPARAAPARGSGGVGRWLVAVVLAGVAVGALAVLAGTALQGPGPASSVGQSGGTGPLPTDSGGPTADPGSPAATTGTPSSSPPGSPAAAQPLALTGATASSVLGGSDRYGPERAIDGDLKTSWQEGSAVEKGQWIEVSFAPSRADTLVVRNGFQASTALFRGNLRLKDVLISVDGGPGKPARLKDATGAQRVSLGGRSGASRVRITIVSTYSSVRTSVQGTPFDDAAVTEIQVLGVPGG